MQGNTSCKECKEIPTGEQHESEIVVFAFMFLFLKGGLYDGTGDDSFLKIKKRGT